MKNYQGRAMADGLGIMANRFLPSIGSDLRVARLLGLVQPFTKPLVAARARLAQDILTRYGGVEGVERLGDLAQQAVTIEIQLAQEGFDLEEMDLGDMGGWPRLSQADLPKERAGEEGWRNGAQLGALVADLGPLFDFPKE